MHSHLKTAIDKLNPNIPETSKAQTMREVLALASLPASGQTERLESLVERNQKFHRMLSDDMAVQYQRNGETVEAGPG